ncbi:Hypothetical predicted protein [Mytilus galloprovincialis]|uniref:Uncharacterized protein n=1 Tax=Mytilus galloprovincialis TaxID=29158 RepID=A0A8B6EKR7_MYTGA|nr:Hypothetical predicted protein [Mytilus galloprovincialis]
MDVFKHHNRQGQYIEQTVPIRPLLRKITATYQSHQVNNIHRRQSYITVTTEGVKKLLIKCNPSKACGPDKIPARILRECADDLAPFLCIAFNASLRSGFR